MRHEKISKLLSDSTVQSLWSRGQYSDNKNIRIET